MPRIRPGWVNHLPSLESTLSLHSNGPHLERTGLDSMVQLYESPFAGSRTAHIYPMDDRSMFELKLLHAEIPSSAKINSNYNLEVLNL